MEFARINNDVNGNPRYVVAYSELLNAQDEKEAREKANLSRPMRFFVEFEYEIALRKARKIGGRKFHNKQFGGGIAFQSYNLADLEKSIIEIRG